MASVFRFFVGTIVAALFAALLAANPASALRSTVVAGASQSAGVSAKAYAKPKAPEGCRDTAKWRMQVRQVDTNIMLAAGLTSQIWVCEYWSRSNPGTRGIKYALFRGSDSASAEAITGVKSMYVAFSDYYDYTKEAVRKTLKEGKWVRLKNMKLTGCLPINPCVLYVELEPIIGNKYQLMQYAAKRVSAPKAAVLA